MEQGVKREIVKIVQSMLSRVDANGHAVMGGIGNWVETADQTLSAPGAAPASYLYAAILVTAQVSGIFQYGWGVPFNSGTTADSITLATATEGWTKANWATITTTGKIALTAATAEGVQGATAGAAINGGSAPGVYIATTGGTPITATVTGASPTTTTQSSVAVPTLTGLLTAQGMQWNSGTVVAQNGTSTAKTPFAIGSPVLIKFLISATNTVTQTGSAFFWASELAIG
jgi:hypothetical protein